MLIRRLAECPECTAGDQTRLRELLHPDRQQAAIRYSLAHAQLEPGAASLPHVLSSSEVYYILSGSGIMIINAEQRTVACGQVVYIPPGAVQSIRNTTQEPLTFLCIVDPAWQNSDETVLTDNIQHRQIDSCSSAGHHAEKKA